VCFSLKITPHSTAAAFDGFITPTAATFGTGRLGSYTSGAACVAPPQRKCRLGQLTACGCHLVFKVTEKIMNQSNAVLAELGTSRMTRGLRERLITLQQSERKVGTWNNPQGQKPGIAVIVL
jgi:hypothetical protein